MYQLKVYYYKYQVSTLHKTIIKPYRNYDNVVKKSYGRLQIKVIKNHIRSHYSCQLILLIKRTNNYVVQAGEAAGKRLVNNM